MGKTLAKTLESTVQIPLVFFTYSNIYIYMYVDLGLLYHEGQNRAMQTQMMPCLIVLYQAGIPKMCPTKEDVFWSSRLQHTECKCAALDMYIYIIFIYTYIFTCIHTLVMQNNTYSSPGKHRISPPLVYSWAGHIPAPTFLSLGACCKKGGNMHFDVCTALNVPCSFSIFRGVLVFTSKMHIKHWW